MDDWGIEPEEIEYFTMKIIAPAYALRPEIVACPIT